MNSNELKTLQQNLDKKDSFKRDYVDANNTEEDEIFADGSDSEDEVSKPIQLNMVNPHSRKGNTNDLITAQYIIQQDQLMKAQKKISKLQNEIDVEEVKRRYLNLDLVNIQVKHDEVQELLTKKYNEINDLMVVLEKDKTCIRYKKIENLVLRGCLLIVLFSIVFNWIMDNKTYPN